VTKGGGTRIVTLYNNHSMKKFPLGEDVEMLARFLGKEQEQPKWYFGATSWMWH
jgi:hypothetical protein